MKNGSDIQPYVRGIKLFNTNKNLTSMISLWPFSYLHHFFHNALIATDDVRSVISLLVIHSPVLYSTVIHRWSIKRITVIII